MNTPHVIEVALLLLVAFLVGCVIGWLLRRAFGDAAQEPVAAAPAEPEKPSSPLPPLGHTEVASRPASAATISGAMAGAAAAAGASEIAAQASDPGAATGAGEAEPELVPEGGGENDMAELSAIDGGAPEAPGEAEPAPGSGDGALDSSAEADAAAGSGNRPEPLPGPLGGTADDLRQIKGIGPKLESTLNGLGVYHFDQIAAWTRGNIDWVDTYLSFKGRIDREEWVAQARALSGSAPGASAAPTDASPGDGEQGAG